MPRRSRRVLAIATGSIVTLSLLGSAMAGPALGLTPTDCRVKNLDTGTIKRRLGAAVKAANAGDRLTVRGTCTGVVIIDRDLTITGIRPARAGTPTLDAADVGTVVTVNGGRTVTIASLTITGGSETGPAGSGPGGGIWNLGSLRLQAVTVRGNRALSGGGIWNGGTLRIAGSSLIARNSAENEGAGIYNTGTVRLLGTTRVQRNGSASSPINGSGVWSGGDGSRVFMSGTATIRQNRAASNGGGAYFDGGTVRMGTGTAFTGNEAGSNGGGLYAFGAVVTLNGTAAITGNAAASNGGGVYLFSGAQMTLNSGAAVSGNEAGSFGGGVYKAGDSTTVGVSCGTNVHDNVPTDCHPL